MGTCCCEQSSPRRPSEAGPKVGSLSKSCKSRVRFKSVCKQELICQLHSGVICSMFGSTTQPSAHAGTRPFCVPLGTLMCGRRGSCGGSFAARLRLRAAPACAWVTGLLLVISFWAGLTLFTSKGICRELPQEHGGVQITMGKLSCSVGVATCSRRRVSALAQKKTWSCSVSSSTQLLIRRLCRRGREDSL